MSEIDENIQSWKCWFTVIFWILQQHYAIRPVWAEILTHTYMFSLLCTNKIWKKILIGS